MTSPSATVPSTFYVFFGFHSCSSSRLKTCIAFSLVQRLAPQGWRRTRLPVATAFRRQSSPISYRHAGSGGNAAVFQGATVKWMRVPQGSRAAEASRDCVRLLRWRRRDAFSIRPNSSTMTSHREPIKPSALAAMWARAVVCQTLRADVVVTIARGNEGRAGAAARHVETERTAIKFFSPRRCPGPADGYGRRAIRPARQNTSRSRIDLADDGVDVERIGSLENRLTVATPLHGRPVGIDLDARCPPGRRGRWPR